MLSVGLLLPFLLVQTERPAQLRSVDVTITQAKDRPLSGLSVQEVVVIENGVAREVTRVERDTRPLDVAMLVDSSLAVSSSYRLNLVEPVLRLLGRLPEGSRYSLWTTGDRPTRLVELTADVREAARALRRVVPQGGNTVLDAIVEAAQDLKQKEGGRRAVVAVAAVGTEFSNRDRYQVVERASQAIDIFDAVLFDETSLAAGAERVDTEQRLNYDYVFGELASRSGGRLERPLSAMGVAPALEQLARDLTSRFRIHYATLPEIGERKLEIRVARPDVKVRVGRSTADAS